MGKFGNFFTTGRKKNTKNTSEASVKSRVKGARPGLPHKGLAPLASIEDIKDITKSEESLIGKDYDQTQSPIQNSVEETEDYIYNKDLTPLYNNIVSEWNSKGATSDSEEFSPEWHSSNETIKNTLFDSNLTLQTLEPEKDLITDTTKTTTPNFFKSLTNIPNEDLEHSILNHKELTNVYTFAESEYAASKEQPGVLESRSSEQAHLARVLTLDIFLRRTKELHLNEPVTSLFEDDNSSTETMDKKSAVRRSGKRRKSQSSSDMPNGDRNVTEITAREEPVFDSVPSDFVSEKINGSERKVKAPQQINYVMPNHEMKAGSNHKGLTKTESEKIRQQQPTSSPCRKKSLKKNLSDTGPLSPTGLKNQGRDSSTKRQTEDVTYVSPLSKCTSVENAFSGETTLETSTVSSSGLIRNSVLPLTEETTDSKVLHPTDKSDVLLNTTDKNKYGEIRTTNGKQISSDLENAKLRSTCLDVSRTTVTTKVSL